MGQDAKGYAIERLKKLKEFVDKAIPLAEQTKSGSVSWEGWHNIATKANKSLEEIGSAYNCLSITNGKDPEYRSGVTR